MVKVEIADDGGANPVEIQRCKEIEVISIITFPKKPIVSKSTPTIDDDAWTGEPREYVIEGYITPTNRLDLEAKKEAYAKIQIEEDDIVVDDGYIISLKSEWRGQENYEYPWYISIKIMSSDKI